MLFETVGGRGDFTRAAEEACGELFGTSVRPLLDRPIITGRDLPGAASLTRVEYRSFARDAVGVRDTTPRLRGILIDGQPRLLFSREDLSQALLDQPCWGIAGYSPSSAQRLLGNIARYAATQDPVE